MGRRGKGQAEVSAIITLEARAYLDGLVAERKRQGDKAANISDVVREALAAYAGKDVSFFMERGWGERSTKK